MGYTLNEETWEIAAEIAKKVAILPEGDSLIIKDQPAAIKRLRYVVYAWLYETQQKPNFKVIQRTPSSLEIFKKVTLRPELKIEDKINAFIESHLLEIDDELEATRRIREAVQRDELTTDQGIRALSEWHRIQGS